MPMAENTASRILPVDSEHSAVFQCLNGEQQEEIHKLLLTSLRADLFPRQKKKRSGTGDSGRYFKAS